MYGKQSLANVPLPFDEALTRVLKDGQQQLAAQQQAFPFQGPEYGHHLCIPQGIALCQLPRQKWPLMTGKASKQLAQGIADFAKKRVGYSGGCRHAQCIAIEPRIFRGDPPDLTGDFDAYSASLCAQRL